MSVSWGELISITVKGCSNSPQVKCTSTFEDVSYVVRCNNGVRITKASILQAQRNKDNRLVGGKFKP